MSRRIFEKIANREIATVVLEMAMESPSKDCQRHGELMSTNLTPDDIAEFSFNFCGEFFLETNKGNFTWQSPDYPGGDNVIRRFNGSLKDYLKKRGLPYVRDKGKHFIRDYCGDATIIVSE